MDENRIDLLKRVPLFEGLDRGRARRRRVGQASRMNFRFGSGKAERVAREGLERQLGHSRPSITLDIYAHEFEKVRNADALRERLAVALAVGRREPFLTEF